MSERRPGASTLVGYGGLVIAVGGIVYQAGQLTGEIAQQKGRIDQAIERISGLEASDRARSDRIQAIDVRTARIEAKLDFIVPAEKK